MTSKEFCHWLQGFMEATPTISSSQAFTIRAKLDTVFKPKVEVFKVESETEIDLPQNTIPKSWWLKDDV